MLVFSDLWNWTLAGEHAGSLSSLSSCWIMWRNCFRFLIGSIHYAGKAARAAGAPLSFPLSAHLHSYKICMVLQENMFSIHFCSLFCNELHNGCMCLRARNICPPLWSFFLSWFENCFVLLDIWAHCSLIRIQAVGSKIYYFFKLELYLGPCENANACDHSLKKKRQKKYFPNKHHQGSFVLDLWWTEPLIILALVESSTKTESV